MTDSIRPPVFGVFASLIVGTGVGVCTPVALPVAVIATSVAWLSSVTDVRQRAREPQDLAEPVDALN